MSDYDEIVERTTELDELLRTYDGDKPLPLSLARGVAAAVTFFEQAAKPKPTKQEVEAGILWDQWRRALKNYHNAQKGGRSIEMALESLEFIRGRLEALGEDPPAMPRGGMERVTDVVTWPTAFREWTDRLRGGEDAAGA